MKKVFNLFLLSFLLIQTPALAGRCFTYSNYHGSYYERVGVYLKPIHPGAIPRNVIWVVNPNALMYERSGCEPNPVSAPPPASNPQKAKEDAAKAAAAEAAEKAAAEVEARKLNALALELDSAEVEHAESINRVADEKNNKLKILAEEQDSRISTLKDAFCFPPETMISLKDDSPAGYHLEPISAIQPGDLVVSYDFRTQTIESGQVEKTIRRTADRLINLSYSGKFLRATENHPFFVVNLRRWVEAKELKKGDQLLDISDEIAVIEDVQIEEGKFTVYNLEVSENNNYFAGKVLVHNCNLVIGATTYAGEALVGGEAALLAEGLIGAAATGPGVLIGSAAVIGYALHKATEPGQDDVGSGGVAENSTSGEKKSTDFVVNEKGEAVPIPDGATGPVPPKRGTGMSYEEGSGGKGMSDRVEGVRIMDANKNQGRRVNYMNKSGQTVDPKTGGTISNSDPRGHLPYGK